MENSNWYQVDNVAKVFLATCEKRDTRTLRVSCTLKEEIDPDMLQKAVDQAITERPQFQVRIRRGIFWHYMEDTDVRPVVSEESRRVCPMLYFPGRKGQLHYAVTYYHNRINLDLFHAISDGTGALEFLNIIVLEYLRQKSPEELAETVTGTGASEDDLNQDSFKQFFGKNGQMGGIEKKAYHPGGLLLPYNQLQFFEVQMPVAPLLAQAKELGVSLTSYIGARFMLALRMSMPSLKTDTPVTITLPVNLRNYYPSNTSRNFFNNINVTHVFKEDISLEDLAKEFDAQMKSNLTPEKIKAQMDHYETMESLVPVRFAPLFIKQFAIKRGTKISDQNVSMVLSNLGVQKPPREMAQYIENYSAFCSSANLFSTVSSYNGVMTLGVTSPYANTGVIKNFIRGITAEDVPVTVYATEVIR